MQSVVTDARERPNKGFTLIELLVVIAMLAILAAFMLSAISRAKSKTNGAICLNHMRQLMAAYLMYAHENHDRVLVAGDHWCGNGAMDWTDGFNNLEETMLVGKYSLIAPYIDGGAILFKCPADTYLSPIQRARGFAARVRSVSINWASGSAQRYVLTSTLPKWRGWITLSEPVQHAPSDLFVILDEHPDSIGDAVFDAAKWAPKDFVGPFSWRDIPATYHDGGGSFSFLDGHSALNKWRGRLASRAWTKVQFRDRHDDAFVCTESSDAQDIDRVITRMAETN